MLGRVLEVAPNPCRFITLFRFITMFGGTDSILQNIPHISLNDGIYCKRQSIAENNVMDLNNVMLSFIYLFLIPSKVITVVLK